MPIAMCDLITGLAQSLFVRFVLKNKVPEGAVLLDEGRKKASFRFPSRRKVASGT